MGTDGPSLALYVEDPFWVCGRWVCGDEWADAQAEGDGPLDVLDPSSLLLLANEAANGLRSGQLVAR